MPTITPNSPRALPKISITRILTKREEFCASDKAQLLPIIPTHSLRERNERKRSAKELVDKYYSHLIELHVKKSEQDNSPTNKICKSHNYSRCKYGIACSKGLWIINPGWRHTLQLCLKNDSHDNSIYGYRLTENYTGSSIKLEKSKTVTTANSSKKINSHISAQLHNFMHSGEWIIFTWTYGKHSIIGKHYNRRDLKLNYLRH